MDPLIEIPADFSELTDDELRSFIEDVRELTAAVAANASDYLGEERSSKQLVAEMTDAVGAMQDAKAELARRKETEEPKPEGEGDGEEGEGEGGDEPAAAAAEDADALSALAARAAEEEAEPVAVEEAEPVAASVAVVKLDASEFTAAVEKLGDVLLLAAAGNGNGDGKRPRPARARSAEPVIGDQKPPGVPLLAAGENLGVGLDSEWPDELSIAVAMVKRRHAIGDVPEGTHGDKVPIARADWRDLYPEDRSLIAGAPDLNIEKIREVVNPDVIKRAMAERREAAGGSLTASGGLCAPVTPYYALQQISEASRPVRDSLAAFNADRGGIRFARPATLASVVGGNAVGIVTMANDTLGGTFATKHCQVIACPPFSEVDVDAIYHCLQFGNLGARAFPELVAQWNSLTMAAHARVAETHLLDGIRTASTLVTASNTMALGATSQLLSQITTAAAALRSRHRMDPDAVLRVLLPEWVLDELASDNIRGQFDRYDMADDDFIGTLRAMDVEPSFYLDGATGRGQVFGTQSAGALNTFPTTVEWYIFPEGSFLFLDGGTLELGLVRDSVLNATNDFQMFGESWENVAFIGVESMAVTTTVDDRGAVSAPHASPATSYA